MADTVGLSRPTGQASPGLCRDDDNAFLGYSPTDINIPESPTQHWKNRIDCVKRTTLCGQRSGARVKERAIICRDGFGEASWRRRLKRSSDRVLKDSPIWSKVRRDTHRPLRPRRSCPASLRDILIHEYRRLYPEAVSARRSPAARGGLSNPLFGSCGRPPRLSRPRSVRGRRGA